MKTFQLTFILLLTFIAGNAQQLQEYIAQALVNNPNIKAYEVRYNLAEEMVNEAAWLPNTEISVGYFASEPETRTGAQRARFSARQMLPWFGTVGTRQEYASSRAASDYMDYIIARRKLGLQVAQSYYDLNSNQARQKVLEENLRLLESYEDLALNAVEVGKASAVDVLRLQIRQNELHQQKDILEQQFKAAQSKFNALLNREGSATVQLFPEIYIPETDPVIADSLQLNPELLKFDRLYESVVQSELVNQKERAPMLGLGLDYVPVQERPDLVFSDNGKDIVMPMVSLSIPVFNPRYDSRTKQNELRKQEIQYQKQERLNMLDATLENALSQRNEARIAYNTQLKNIKQAKDAEQILIKSYETGTIDFKEVLDIQEMQLKFQMNQIQSVQKYFTQSAIINYLIKM
ncbi:TolC family protein [Lentiprolixibacter aurantiacus]|uniref:TolC family protein n=1 Tax=Lentiprolixibacter aurantiacus TaxID=2993939 RepID=A0AAE3SP08_9FLAO|nr:TolC family protein [Lentiprolixibacter aurantiacus]MCX2720342.1 TolC family protein [Lentiprolixibacter aurantiacus]